ncbi:MAG: DUF1585 domain-containing protein [Archangiaceae bacterium]|nr:DUF1585 domain-containing protein [Archangiaceae bacterium]
MRRSAGLLSALLLGVSSSALAQEQCVDGMSQVPLERHLRQLYLDLLARPPNMDEYRFIQAKGIITEADVDELMSRDEFFARVKGYHRSLLRTNVSASVYDNGDTRVNSTTDGFKPLESRGNPSASTRGRNGLGCDHFIQQDSCNAATQDPHLEGTSKLCRDTNGVPMPVSVDYDTGIFACTPLAAADCAAAAGAGLLAGTGGGVTDKLLYFCDNRRQTNGTLAPFLCLPDPAKPTTMNMTAETLDGAGRVVSFANATVVPGAAYNQLDRCDLSLGLRNGVKGSYVTRRGCWVREGVAQAPAPFWDKSGVSTVTVCAIEAQDRAVNPVTMESCETGRFMSDRSCGCGAGFRRCEFAEGTTNVQSARVNAVNEEPLQITDSVVRREEDYFNILTTRRSFLNSALSEFYREKQGVGVWAVTPPSSLEALPAIDYTMDANTWLEYTRDPNNAGVLTTPAFLYRFPTYRSRVNVFYEAFLCKHFSPPPDAKLPPADDACNRENNLARRCGCNYCHATIEPTGAHWGRYGERNATFLDPVKFPRYDAKCRDCALAGNTNCDGECSNYVMQALDGDGANSLGLLKTYLYRTPDEEPNISGGPRLLVERMLQTGDLERCAVKNVWKEMLGRPMSDQEQALYMEKLTGEWLTRGRSFKELMKLVIDTDAYRRID